MLQIETLLPLIPALPLVSAIVAIALGLNSTTRRFAHVPVILALAAACGASVLLLVEVQRGIAESPAASFERVVSLWTWMAIPGALESGGAAQGFTIDVALRADTLTCAMLAMVTFVASLVAIYASGYMEGDEGFARFFAYVGLFVFSMTMLVSVSNFVLLFVFWEAVGLCSYLLIGFWYQKPEAAEAGKKAFLVNRIGDFGFTLAIFLIWITYGTLNFHDTSAKDQPHADAATPAAHSGVLGVSRLIASQRGKSGEEGGYFGGTVGIAICLLLMLGACGKSAQFPLHIWLPDAMEGPTPVSALIHAATMVTAGVYMVARCTPLFMVSPEAQLTVSLIGGFTAILAALIALTQFDLKRVLAYSTVSQLGYMFLALGAGTFSGVTAGMFHLYTHAFFKALLFLGAGSVMHAMGGVIDMRRFSGLKDLMPWTCGTFLIGSLALAGVFPLAGFFSKDAVLAAVHDRAHDYAAAAEGGGHAPVNGIGTDTSSLHDTRLTHLKKSQLAAYGSIYQGLYYLGLFTAFLTAFYTFRAFFMTFFGEERIPHEAGHHAHESPWAMTLPLVVLAICSCIVGLMLNGAFAPFLGNAPQLALGTVAETRPGPGHHADHTAVAIFSTVAALLGIALAAYFYLGHRREVQSLKSLFNLEWASRSESRYLVSPYELSYHKFFFDEIYNVLVVWPLRLLAAAAYWIDRTFVDGLVNLFGWLPGSVGSLLRSLQVGLVPYYALAMVLGLIALVASRVLLAT